MRRGTNFDLPFSFAQISRQPLPKEDVLPQLSQTYGAKTSEIEGLDRSIEDTWEQKIKEKGSRLWNGLKFRIGKIEPQNGKVELHLGLTDYKTFLTTAYHPKRTELEKRGIEKYGDPTAHLGCNLGVGTILETADHQILFIRRSETVAEYPGYVATPAGHPEPIHMFPQLDPKSTTMKDLYSSFSSLSAQRQHELLLHELFDSSTTEAEEECNISRKTFSEPLLLGVVTNLETGYVPDLEFYIRTSLSLDQVKDAYRQSFEEKWESSALTSRSVEEVLSFVDPASGDVNGKGLKLAPPTAGSILLFHQWRGKK